MKKSKAKTKVAKARPKAASKPMSKAWAKAQSNARDNAADLLSFVENLKRQWMSTIDALVDPLLIVKPDYSVSKANLALARMGGVDVKDVVGRKCYDLFAGRSSPCPGCRMKNTAKEAKEGAFELEGIRDGRYYEVTSQPLFDREGKSDGVVQVYRDRTEAKKFQEQLAQQEKLASIGMLAGGVAHEINNPLGGILIFSQMLLRELDKESPHYADVVEIEAATQRCKAIVESLLDFARQNPAGAAKKKVEEINALEAIRTAIRFGKVSVKQGGHVEINEEFEAAEHRLVGDRNRIIQLFLNLIQNAVQAMPDGGELVIRARTREAESGRTFGVYQVVDSGVGIAPENMKLIFDPFFTTKDPGEGTGLGLALCYGIVQDLGGTMTVESTVNVGTTFTIEIPLAAAVGLSKSAS